MNRNQKLVQEAKNNTKNCKSWKEMAKLMPTKKNLLGDQSLSDFGVAHRNLYSHRNTLKHSRTHLLAHSRLLDYTHTWQGLSAVLDFLFRNSFESLCRQDLLAQTSLNFLLMLLKWFRFSVFFLILVYRVEC